MADLSSVNPAVITAAEKVFSDFASRGSGKIERKDMNNLLKTLLNKTCNQNELNAIMKEADADNDGKISKDEFLDLFVKEKDGRLISEGLIELLSYLNFVTGGEDFSTQKSKKNQPKKKKAGGNLRKSLNRSGNNLNNSGQKIYIFTESIECDWTKNNLRYYVSPTIKANQLEDKAALKSVSAGARKYSTPISISVADAETDLLTTKRQSNIGKVAFGSQIRDNTDGEFVGVVGVFCLVFSEDLKKLLVYRENIENSPSGKRILYLLDNDYIPHIKIADAFLVDLLSHLYPEELNALLAWVESREDEYLTSWQNIYAWTNLKKVDVASLGWLRDAIKNVKSVEVKKENPELVLGGGSKPKENDYETLIRHLKEDILRRFVASSPAPPTTENSAPWFPESALVGPFHAEAGENLIKKFYFVKVNAEEFEKRIVEERNPEQPRDVQFIETSTAEGCSQISPFLSVLQSEEATFKSG